MRLSVLPESPTEKGIETTHRHGISTAPRVGFSVRNHGQLRVSPELSGIPVEQNKQLSVFSDSPQRAESSGDPRLCHVSHNKSSGWL